MPDMQVFDDRQALDTALSAAVSERLQMALASRDKAYLVVSGGSTPANLFSLLACTPIPWHRVVVLLADERWVPADDKDRNERLVRESLLTQHASDAEFISLIPASVEDEADTARVSASVAALPTFDVVLLGMGEDAHTASLFPCSAELQIGMTTHEGLLITRPASAPHKRVSLSKHRLSNTRQGILHIVGETKKVVLQRAVLSGDEMQFPVCAFTSQPGFTCWWAP